MKKNIDSKQLGKIIKHFRNQKSISQEKLANALKIPRTAISQIENGGRDLPFSELQKLLSLFEVSFEEFVSQTGKEHKTKLDKVRNINKKIKFDSEKFKQLFLYILEKRGGKPNVGETVLYKLLYFCDFDYFEIYEKPLTGMKYKKMQFGPVPNQNLFNPAIKEMKESGMIERISKPYLNETIQTRYLNFAEADLSIFGSDTENVRKVVDAVIERLSSMSARQIEEHSHRDFPWQIHEFEEEIDYSNVFYRSGVFANRDYEKEFIENLSADAAKALPPLTEKEYKYYMSLPD